MRGVKPLVPVFDLGRLLRNRRPTVPGVWTGRSWAPATGRRLPASGWCRV